MQKLLKTGLKMDPGLPRRFTTNLHLVDYTPAELAEICRRSAEREFGLTFQNGFWWESLLGTSPAKTQSSKRGALGLPD